MNVGCIEEVLSVFSMSGKAFLPVHFLRVD